MTSICFIGNSHLAAIKKAWDKMQDGRTDPELRVTFFVSRGNTLSELSLQDNKLVPTSELVRTTMIMSSGGLSEIALDAYDVFVLHGIDFTPAVLDVPEMDAAELGGHIKLQPCKVGRGCASLKLARIISRANKPFIISPTPFPSEELVGKLNQVRRPRPWQWIGKRVANNGANLSPQGALGLLCWDRYLRASNALAQPKETITKGYFTLRTYTKRYADHEALHDYVHMNAEYGAIILRAAIARCKEGSYSNLIDSIPAPTREEVAAQIERIGPVSELENPYRGLPDYSFWRRTVSKEPLQITDWYRKKFNIGQLKVATAGSCFAQHIGRQLKKKGFSYVDVEMPPPDMPECEWQANGYGLYSARYGNVYTTRQLRQLFDRAYGRFLPKEVYWEKDGGYVDPFRPTIQTAPFSSIEALVESREQHLAAVRKLFEEAQIFVFTLGLTETWESIEDGAVFPVAPGVSGGKYSPEKYRLRNLTMGEVSLDLKYVIDAVRKKNPNIKFILTVSPVPLMATATRHQVVVATTYSKSVLRAVAGQIADNRPYVDYFPSFEIINSHVMRTQLYEEDLRTVKEDGVAHVMQQFFLEHRPLQGCEKEPERLANSMDVQCDEELLTAFGGSVQSD